MRMSTLTGIKSYLKAIEEGNFNNFDEDVFIKKLESDGFKYSDNLQFSLHKFCRVNTDAEVNVTVINLSKLCFSKESASRFNNMDRFLGSLFHITSYFLKRNNCAVALEISNSIDYKKTEIEKYAFENADTANIIYSLHSLFLTTAQAIASEMAEDGNKEEMHLSYELAQKSIKFLKLLKKELPEIGKRIIRNFRNYFSSLKVYERKNIYLIYKEMELILSTVMPKKGKISKFLHFYLYKVDLIENELDMNLTDMNKYFSKNVKLISIFLNDSKSLKYWQIILSVDELSESYLKNFLGAAMKIISSQCECQLLLFSIFFNHAAQLWTKYYSNEWTKIFSSTITEQMYKSLFLPMKNHARCSTEFSPTQDFKIDICLMDMYKYNLLWVLHMIRFGLKFNVPGCIDLIGISREIFHFIKKDENETTNACCLNKKKQIWNNLVIYYTNTVEGLLRQPDSDIVWTHMKDCCEELLFEVMNTKLELPYDWKRVKILFQRWHFSCLKLKEYEEALFISTFLVVSYPLAEEEAISMWIQTKKFLSDDHRQSLTFKDIIDKENDRMKCMNPKCEPLSQDLRRLLMLELMAYSSCPAFDIKTSESFMKLLLNIWETMKKLDLDLCDKAAALNNVVIAAISTNNSETVKKYKRECEKVVAEILELKDTKRNCRSLLYAGNLKYALFLCHLKSIQDAEDRSNASKSILEYLKKEEEQKVKFGEDVDLNLTCNVMPSTNHFTVSFEENYLTALNETLNFWEEASDRVNSSSLEPHEFNSWLHNIKHIAHMYYLIGDVHQSFVSWILYYQIAKICGNHSSLLLALSYIIPECTKVENTKLLQQAEEIADKLSSEAKEKDLIPYWLAVGLNHLKNKNKMECLNYLMKIKQALPYIKDNTRYHMCCARYWCLASKFLLLYHDEMDKFDIKPKTELMNIIFKAFNHANNSVRDGINNHLGSGEYMEILMTMLEVNVWAFNVFAVCSQAAFMRLFLDDLYQIFQKLVLPTRTAFVLILLAEVDIMCEKVDEASTKLSSLKRILGRSHVSPVEEDFVEHKKSEKLEVPRSAEDELESPRVLSPMRFLEVRDSHKERDPSPLRYVLNEVDLVKRLTHLGRCNCYTCRSLMIKFLCTNALLLEARLNQINGSAKKSCILFKDGYKQLKKLELHQTNLNEGMSKAAKDFRGIIDFQGDLIRMNSAKFLIHYAIFVLTAWKGDLMKEVDKIIGKIGRAMKTFSYEEKLLQWKFVEVKLVSSTIHELNIVEMEQPKKVPMRVIHSPNRMMLKTPVATKKPNGNGAPYKYKQAKLPKSPNAFITKPPGRKIFNDDDEEELTPKKILDQVEGVKTRRKAAAPVKEINRITRKNKQNVLTATANVEVEPLS